VAISRSFKIGLFVLYRKGAIVWNLRDNKIGVL